MTQPPRTILFAVALLALFLFPSAAFGWGAGMHATLTAHGHERMTARWKDALDRGLLIYGSFGPDVWYIQKVGEEAELVCPVACGPDDGRISNECWGNYEEGPDRYFAYARQLLVHADSLPAISWAFGYAAHAVEDWRGHMEYIIPDWVNPGSGMKNRHTLVDASGSALAFNYKGLHGYPSLFTMDRTTYGYPEGGFVNAQNAQATGARIPELGLGLDIRQSGPGKRIVWNGILDEALTGLGAERLGIMADFASLGSASEGILAAQYGVTRRYDSLGHDWPIVVEEDEVAINCGTDFRQRFISDQGAGHAFACQIYNASLLSAVVYGAAKPAIWFNYLKPHETEPDQIVVDDDMVELWMGRFATHFEWDGVRLDDQAVFGINPETGLSERHLEGVDGRDFTFGRTLPEIVGEVLELSVQDLVERVLEEPAFVGAVLQSDLNPVDKARFITFGFGYRPRLSAWPETLEYEDRPVTLHPGAPGPFAHVQVPFDMSSAGQNAAPDMIFPYYLVTLHLETETAHGLGRFRGEIAYRNDSDERLGEALASFAFDTNGEDLQDPDGVALMLLHGDTAFEVQVLLDNRAGGWYVHNPQDLRAALVLDLELEIVDGSQPPFDFILHTVVQPYCTAPDLANPGTPSADNSLCPLNVPEFPDPDGDEELEDGDAEPLDGDEEPVQDGDLDEPEADGDVQEPTDGDDGEDPTPSDENASSSGGCQAVPNAGAGGLVLLLLVLAYRRRQVRHGL